MSRGPWKHKPTVLSKALTEAREAGARVKIGKDGGIEIDFGKTGTADNPDVSQDTPESVKALI
jgi:hypothetical protein